MRAGFPAAAERLRKAGAAVGGRALEVAIQRDPTFAERWDETALRLFLRDTETFVERLAQCVASDDVRWLREWADWVSPVYRRRRVPMDDLVTLCEGLREAAGAVLGAEERPLMDEGIDAAIAQFRWYRRLAGDARKKNRLVTFLYKGA